MPNQNDADPPVRSQDPFRKASDPLSRETANDDDRAENVVTEVETYDDNGPDAVGKAEADAQARSKQADDASGRRQAEQQARQAGSGTTGHEVEPEANADMNLGGFDKKKK